MTDKLLKLLDVVMVGDDVAHVLPFAEEQKWRGIECAEDVY